jgi:hypothetical protein
VRKSGITFAPEVGSSDCGILSIRHQGMRIFAAARAAFSQGWCSIKLFFMIGIPGESARISWVSLPFCRINIDCARQNRPPGKKSL